MAWIAQKFIDRFSGADSDLWTDTSLYERFYMPSTDASRVTTPDHADFAPPATTTAWDIRGEIDALNNSLNETLLSQWTSGQQSFVLVHSHAGFGSIRLYWSNRPS